VKQAAFAIGKQAGVSIAILDPTVLGRPAPAIHRQSNADRALVQLAKGSGLKVLRLGAASYALMPAPAKLKRLRAKAVQPARTEKREPAALQPGIIVVASKRDTMSSRFSGAWSRIDGDEFANLGVEGADAIEARTVSFSSTHLGSGRNKLFIRGIADSSFSGPTQSPVGEYFDDVRTGYSGADPDLKLVDIDSVEVLEGPQGTLYGSGALGGIVLIRPNKPMFDDASGSVAGGGGLTWHGAGSFDISGVVNLPIESGAAFRGVAYHSYEGGYIDNKATGEPDVNGVRVTGGRAALSIRLGDDWFADAGAAGQRIAGDDSQYADVADGDWARSSLVKQPFSSSFGLGTLVLRKDAGPVRFRSTSAITRQNVDETFDASIGDHDRELHQHSRGRSVSNETRLWRPMADGYSWLAGFSTIWNNYRVSRDLRQGAYETDLAGAENRVHETTLFGEVAVRLSPRVEATLGARYTIAALSGSGQHLSAVSTEPEARRTERSFLPSASLLFRPTDRLTLYGRFQQGFRPGGLSIIADSVSLYNSDRLKTGEIGFRWGQRGRDDVDLQASATYSQWDHIQADFLDDRGLPSTSNIGDGRVITLAANGGACLTDGLRAEAGIAWNNGKITKPEPWFLAASSVQDGAMEIPNIARIVARGALDWRGRISDRWDFKANLYARYVGHSRLGIGPRLGEVQGEYFDSGASFRLENDQVAWSLSITNISNSVGNRFAFGALGSDKDQITPLRPRTIRLGFEKHF
jgi:outer membrane receptor protein involved in Fe transport